jgi:DNA polymerase-3 subunit delta'
MSFNKIKGHDRIIGILKGYMQQSRLGRSYLFLGPDSIGKKMLARTLAKGLNCRQQDLEPCDCCPSCLKIEENRHPDVYCIDDSESDSIKIEDIRKLQKDINLRPYEGRTKVFIVDNAHNLTPEASGAFLKILEEPPENSLILVITSKPALLFKTIISRCQILRFYPMRRQALKDMLITEYGVNAALAHFLGFFSEGRLGLALRLKDTDIFEKKNRIIDCLGIKQRSVPDKFFVDSREDMRSMLNILAVWFRDVYLKKSGMPLSELVNIDRKDEVVEAAGTYSFASLDETFNCISDSLLRIEQNINIKLLLSNLRYTIK